MTNTPNNISEFFLVPKTCHGILFGNGKISSTIKAVQALLCLIARRHSCSHMLLVSSLTSLNGLNQYDFVLLAHGLAHGDQFQKTVDDA